MTVVHNTLAVLCLAPATLPVLDDAKTPSMAWRLPENDVVNSAYVMLRAHGVQVSYQDVVSQIRVDNKGPTFSDLRAFLARNGLRTTLVNCSPDILRRSELPAIVLLESPREDHAAFTLLIDINDTRCTVIYGGFATVQVLLVDSFRRMWSGHALIEKPSILTTNHVISVSILVLSAIVAQHVLRNRIPSRR